MLAHQRIFAVSAYLPGIMDTAQNGRMSDYTGCVPAFAHRQTPAWAVVSPQLKMGRPDSQYAGLNPLFFQERLQALGFHHF